MKYPKDLKGKIIEVICNVEGTLRVPGAAAGHFKHIAKKGQIGIVIAVNKSPTYGYSIKCLISTNKIALFSHEYKIIE